MIVRTQKLQIVYLVIHIMRLVDKIMFYYLVGTKIITNSSIYIYLDVFQGQRHCVQA